MAQNITFLVGLIMGIAEGPNLSLTPMPPSAPSVSVLGSMPLSIIRRSEWGAQPPLVPASPLTILPGPYVIISHTASEPCFTQAECSQRVRTAQTMHMEWNKWDDIGYNFLVGGDGNVYVGRGWDVQGSHTLNYNAKSIGITFIGTFTQVMPLNKQLIAAQQLLELGLSEGKLAKNYTLLGQRQVSETLSPGEVLYWIIQMWPHWSTTPYIHVSPMMNNWKASVE